MAEPTDSDGEFRIGAASRREAEGVSLVLAAEGIPHRIASHGDSWFVAVDSADCARADAALATYARENAPEPAPARASEPAVETLAGLWLALALVAAYAYTGGGYDGSVWFERGANDARLVVAGELWRTVTALTLHSDVAHVLGNAFSCAVFGSLLMRRYGAGVGGALLLASGALGNWLSSEWQQEHYRSVGASTALFGAVGALAATELVRRRRLHLPAERVWLPLAGGFALVAMLGTGKGSDLSAHFMGLAAGALVGFAAARLAPRPVTAAAQLGFGAVTLGVLAWAWWLALASHGA